MPPTTQASPVQVPNTFYLVTLIVERVVDESTFIKERLSPPHTHTQVPPALQQDFKHGSPAARIDRPPSLFVNTHTARNIKPVLARPHSHTVTSMFSSADYSAPFSLPPVPTPVPAGIVGTNDQYYYAPVNIPPVPVGHTHDGRPFYTLPQKPMVVPCAYTLKGIPLFPTNPVMMIQPKPSQIAGYTHNGLPFLIPVIAKLVPPSGYTPQGIPYYYAHNILRYLEHGPTMKHITHDDTIIAHSSDETSESELSDVSGTTSLSQLEKKNKGLLVKTPHGTRFVWEYLHGVENKWKLHRESNIEALEAAFQREEEITKIRVGNTTFWV